MVDHPKFVAHSDWRETFRLSEVDDDTCKLVILTDDQLEILRRALKCARKRGNWIDSEDADGYMTPDDGDWDDTLALLDDLEWRLMSACDYVTLDDENERVGISEDTPLETLHITTDRGLVVEQDDNADRLYFVWNGETSFNIATYRQSDSRRLPISLQSAGGNVGIGKTDPSYALDVNGAARVSGAFGCNGATPRSSDSIPVASSDLATVIALANSIRQTLKNFGLVV